MRLVWGRSIIASTTLAKIPPIWWKFFWAVEKYEEVVDITSARWIRLITLFAEEVITSTVPEPADDDTIAVEPTEIRTDSEDQRRRESC